MKLRIVYGIRTFKFEAQTHQRTVGQVARSFAKGRCIPGDAFTLHVEGYGVLPESTATRQYLGEGGKAALVPL